MQQRKPWFCQDCRDVLMLYNAKEDYHICPKCKTRVYHADEKDDYLNDEVRSLMVDMAATHRQKEVLVGGAVMPGGGNRNRSRKKPIKKDTLATLNKKLYAEC